MNNYELIEHTADIGIRVRGEDLKTLFTNAGLAIFQLSAEKNTAKASKQKVFPVKIKAETLEDLFVNWLNELLSLSAAKGIIFEDFNINKLTEKNLEARAKGADIASYKVNTELKAATYHQLKIEQTQSGWRAEVILDV